MENNNEKNKTEKEQEEEFWRLQEDPLFKNSTRNIKDASSFKNWLKNTVKRYTFKLKYFFFTNWDIIKTKINNIFFKKKYFWGKVFFFKIYIDVNYIDSIFESNNVKPSLNNFVFSVEREDFEKPQFFDLYFKPLDKKNKIIYGDDIYRKIKLAISLIKKIFYCKEIKYVQATSYFYDCFYVQATYEWPVVFSSSVLYNGQEKLNFVDLYSNEFARVFLLDVALDEEELAYSQKRKKFNEQIIENKSGLDIPLLKIDLTFDK